MIDMIVKGSGWCGRMDAAAVTAEKGSTYTWATILGLNSNEKMPLLRF